MYQAGQDYVSDSGCLMFRVKTANNSMCGGELLEFNFETEIYEHMETFLFPHNTIDVMLDDGDDFDPDEGQPMEIIFTPDW